MAKKIKVVVLDENGNEIKKPFGDKVSETLDTIKLKTGEAYRWCVGHKEEVLGLIPLGLGLIGLAKQFKPTKQETERERIDTTYYDPHTGLHWQLRRKLTNDERAELARRQRLGEYTEDILERMRVLK